MLDHSEATPESVWLFRTEILKQEWNDAGVEHVTAVLNGLPVCLELGSPDASHDP